MSTGNGVRRRRLAFLTDCFEDEFQGVLLRSLVAEVAARGCELVSVQGGVLDDPAHQARRFTFDLVSPANVDAVLISTHTIGHLAAREEVEAFVAGYAPLPRVSLGYEVTGVPSLLVDNEGGMALAVEHLLVAHGCRRIAFISGPERNPEARARLAGYRRALESAGVEVDCRLVAEGDFHREAGARAVAVLLDERGLDPGELDAIVAANDEMAVGALGELARRGIEVPADLAVVGFDDMAFARHQDAPLTTVRQPLERQVRHAVEQLCCAVDGQPMVPGPVTFATTLEVRRSCGCDGGAGPSPVSGGHGRGDRAVSLAAREANLAQRMQVLSAVTGCLLAAPDLSSLGAGLAELQQVGVSSSLVALYPESDRTGEELEVAAVFDSRASTPLPLRFRASDLAPPGFLDGRNVVLQPLTLHGERLGIALFEYGSDGFVFELLRRAISSAVKGALLTRAIEKLAVQDPLTGLYNRRYLAGRMEDEFERARRHRRPVNAIIIDLDGFKQVNDRYGHAAGDSVLKRVAERLQLSTRKTDVVARIGGDEFVVLQPETTGAEGLTIATRLLAALNGLDDNRVVTASLGVAGLEAGAPPCEPEELLRRADQALLAAKAAGKARVVAWSES